MAAKDKYVSINQAKGKVKEIYEDLKKERGMVPKFYMALAADPDFLEAFYKKRNRVMRSGKINLATKRMIAFALSVINNCEE